jgi:hypothetical protein
VCGLLARVEQNKLLGSGKNAALDDGGDGGFTDLHVTCRFCT